MAKDTDEYMLVSNQHARLVEEVNKLISEGWVPLGAPIEISEPDMNAFVFVQALVRGRTAERLFGVKYAR